jgi:serine/threonine-protein kinase
MGAIWRAEHLTLEAPVAVKLIDRDAVHDEQTVARFLREAKAAASLRSPHVVQIIDYGVDDGVPFIVMELLEGETLAQRLKRVKRLNAADTARFVTHIARAIARAHEAGIVHRDLKPENVFIVHNEDEEIAKVLDFGVAKVERGVLAEGEKTRTGSILGTPYYMSPEQAQGNKAVDYRSDLWSLGVIAYECLCGRRPFFSDGLGDLVLQICVRDLPVPSEASSVPLGFDAWFRHAMEREPADRFQSAREMTDALREALGLEAREPGPTAPEISISNLPEFPESSGARDKDEEQDVLRRGSPLSRSAISERAEMETLAADPLQPHSQPSRRSSADPTAATFAYSPDRVQSELEARPAFDAPHSTGSGLGVVVAVAALALALGLGGGMYALQRYNLGPKALVPPPSRTDQIPAESAERSPRPRETSEPVAHKEAGAGIGSSSPAEVAPVNSAAPRTAVETVPVKEAREPESKLDAGVRATAQPDAGWVKPAWAIPDPEPKRIDDLEMPREH